ncbi:MAG: tRNA (guanine-N1)-methyltransferase [Flavobacteriales bacterium]|nr:tRNA (guanine-N1)-methyltransferase [Flavobacteriales bacterium]
MKNVAILLFTVIISSTYFAQEPTAYDPSKATLKEQFDEMYRKSNNYQDYKVVKKVRLNAYWKNISDTLKTLNVKITDHAKKINEQANEISILKNSAQEAEDNISTLTAEKDGISFMGSLWSKSKYKTTMWTIVFALLAGLAFAIIRFLNSNRITKNTRTKLAQVEGEFDTYRKTAIQREQEIKRELQDYINKVADLTGNP